MIDLDSFRLKAREWLASSLDTYGKDVRKDLIDLENLKIGKRYQRAKYEAGFAGIHWDQELGGQGLTPLHKMVFEQEEMPLGMPISYFGVSLGIAVPVMLRFAADKAWAKERALAALKGDEIWCQLFSEPSGGSDLAGLRTRASPVEGGWRINGQKLWTTWAQHSDYGVILVRTDPTVPKHKGITFFWINMKAPGVTVRPVRLAAGDSHVNEVFFDDVFVADDQRLSPVGGGFGTAIAALAIERYSAFDPAGFGPPLDVFLSLARESKVNGRPAMQDARIRSSIARAYALRSGLKAISTRAMRMMEAGMEPGPEGALGKLMAVRSAQKLSEVAIDLMGNDGLAWDRQGWGKDDWVVNWLNAPTLRLAGGADEMLLNTIAERILGLPQDHRPDKGVPFNQIPA